MNRVPAIIVLIAFTVFLATIAVPNTAYAKRKSRSETRKETRDEALTIGAISLAVAAVVTVIVYIYRSAKGDDTALLKDNDTISPFNQQKPKNDAVTASDKKPSFEKDIGVWADDEGGGIVLSVNW